MAMNDNVKCENCGSETFVDDVSRFWFPYSDWYSLDGEYKLDKMYIKCSKCGWQLSEPVQKPNDTITITFKFKNDEPKS
jgi:DNA-directed RNA polymerase subunit RPC12/RpoP